MIVKNINELIGNTPVVEYKGIFVKLEYFNATGSVKDRAAKWMIEGLEKDGLLKPGDTIIEPTSGNTGISLAMIGASKGYKVILVMPDTMSKERQDIMRAYGAYLILTDGALGMNGAIAEANKLVEENKYIMPQQFENNYNVLVHEESTAKEIIKDFKELDYFIAGIGTGGTITGVGKILKKYYPNIKIIGIEPDESPIITKGQKGAHTIQGIGAGFVPKILNLDYVDEVVTISSDVAKTATIEAAKSGLFLGISSGAAIKIGLNILEKDGKDKKILVIAPDSGLKYLSTETYKSAK